MLYIFRERIPCVLLCATASYFCRTIAADSKALYAVDIAPPLDVFDARCLNISARLGVELFMLPFSPNLWDGWQQVDKLYNGLRGCKISVKRVWLVIASPSTWYFDIQQNNWFIKQVIDKAREYKIDVGIYTKEIEWMQITGGYVTFTSTPLLWYWNIKNPGPLGETSINFADFRPFDPWKAPTVKQFGQRVSVCGRMVNRDIYFATFQRTSRNVSTIGDATFQ
ncbi:hypothetical protein ANCDUO_10196 [Ancylostoma duodenale]|uniref:Uncharacterized protein n=1 Tax=Ancylostoma duodenale TaxID=51022 RepID=A0A0C2GEG3_9BILA|nr:hypothetical protein ANCDUO_10196 [Ancylostoma duodenale]